MSIKEALSKVKEHIPATVKLIAVSKTKPNEVIMEAYKAGQRAFGENKVQDLVKKYETLPKDIEWHMIGHLQRNKVKYITPFVSLIHGVDSFRLLQEVDKEAAKSDRKVDCLLQFHIAENEDMDFILGGDFNTVLNPEIDKRNGLLDTHKKCRCILNNIIDIHDLADIWRIQHPDTKKYTWHSSHKPPIFCRLDYFLISNNLINSSKNSSIKPGYKTDHSFITFCIDFYKIPRGPSYFKFNNSLLLDTDFKNIIKISILETARLNNEANPNTLWEIIKGNIRKETIKYATYKKRKETQTEKKIIKK